MKKKISNKRNNLYIESHLLLNLKVKLLKSISLILSTVFLSLFFSSIATAHRGAKNEVDTCRILIGNEIVHFSAYTPTLTPGESYCHTIPEAGITNLVIDYEGTKLRNTTVEFEVTKEPEGTRIYYQKPEKIKKGSWDAKIDFSGSGAGEYLTHITIMNQGKKLDSHIPFTVGIEEDNFPYKLVIPIVLIIITLIGIQVKVKNREPSSDDYIDS
ncbi:MAG: hypothetical protein KAH20_15065 [Methylococcales bacterium]|nr:hypothetical protein [Methylococcales bacterium]